MLFATYILLGFASQIAPIFADDEPVNVLLTKANAALARGQNSEALTIFSNAIEKDNRNYMTYFRRATTYLAMSRHSAALSDFDKVLSLKPDFSAAILQRGKVMASLGRWDAALEDLKQSGEAPELIKEIAVARQGATTAEKLHASKLAEKCIEQAGQAISVASASAALRLLRAKCYVLNGETEEAIGDLVFAAKLNPSSAEVQMLSANLFFFALDDSNRAIQQLKACLHYDPDAKACKKSFRSLKKLVKQRDALTKAKDAKTWLAAKKLLLGTGEQEGLLRLIDGEREDLIKENVLSEKLHYVLSANIDELACVILGEAKDANAMKYCESALNANPSSIDSICMKATLLIKAEDYDIAIDFLNKSNEATGGQDQRIRERLEQAHRALKVSKQKDYYKVLGVERDADTKTIKKKYRQLTKQFHPDKYRGELTKEQVVKKIEGINEAYEVLTTPELRQRFDMGDDPNAPPDQNHNPFANHGFHQGGGQQFFHHDPFAGFGGGGGGHTFKFSF